MTYHVSYKSDGLARCYDAIDSILAIVDKRDAERRWRVADSLIARYEFSDALEERDIRALSADFLIRNIEESFAVWEESPWCQHLDFADFCEYILPYRVKDGYWPEGRAAIRIRTCCTSRTPRWRRCIVAPMPSTRKSSGCCERRGKCLPRWRTLIART